MAFPLTLTLILTLLEHGDEARSDLIVGTPADSDGGWGSGGFHGPIRPMSGQTLTHTADEVKGMYTGRRRWGTGWGVILGPTSTSL